MDHCDTLLSVLCFSAQQSQKEMRTGTIPNRNKTVNSLLRQQYINNIPSIAYFPSTLDEFRILLVNRMFFFLQPESGFKINITSTANLCIFFSFTGYVSMFANGN